MRMMDTLDTRKTALLIGTVITLSILPVLWSYARAETRMLPHPQGCPAKRFCGCGAAVEIFGRPIRDLWLSSNWFRFPRTKPVPGAVAVRRGHVFVLRRHLSGNRWIVADYNSGGNRSRVHARSLAGYVTVNPLAYRVAGR